MNTIMIAYIIFSFLLKYLFSFSSFAVLRMKPTMIFLSLSVIFGSYQSKYLQDDFPCTLQSKGYINIAIGGNKKKIVDKEVPLSCSWDSYKIFFLGCFLSMMSSLCILVHINTLSHFLHVLMIGLKPFFLCKHSSKMYNIVDWCVFVWREREGKVKKVLFFVEHKKNRYRERGRLTAVMAMNEKFASVK